MPRTAKQPELTEPQAFAQRLRAALTAADVAVSPTTVQRKFNALSGDAPVSVHGIRKWIMGESIPTQRRIQVLATWLAVSPNWLRFGERTAKDTTQAPSAVEHVLLRSFRRLSAREQEQLLALVQTMAGKRGKR
jgi:hypothetical protein